MPAIDRNQPHDRNVQERTSASRTTGSASAHRTDIDGLRGLAIALVVVFHIFVGRVSAGVDVFLLIGGIFFFASQYRNALRPQGNTIVQTLWRMLRRLYPALVVAVSGSFFLALLTYSPARWTNLSGDAIASLFYVQNVNLARQGQDYAAIDNTVSLYQHLWSMAAQMQVYAGSLFVLTLLALVMRRFAPTRANLAFQLVLSAATLASFFYAWWLHAFNQGWNYYSALSRFWEIGLGGLLATFVLQWRIPAALRTLRVPAGVLGLGIIAATGWLLDGANLFPGPSTLVPLLGAVLVMLSCNPGEGRQYSVAPLLESSPLQFLGRVSYSLYLWHWPLLVLATYIFAPPTTLDALNGTGISATLGVQLGAIVGLGVIVVSLALAVLTYQFVEQPLRQKARSPRSWVLWDFPYQRQALLGRPWLSVMAIAILGLGVGTAAAGTKITQRAAQPFTLEDVQELSRVDYPGPDAYLHGAAVPPVPIVPPARQDPKSMAPPSDRDGCAAQYPDVDVVFTHQINTGTEPCAYGDVDSQRTLYMVGSSHVEHLIPGVAEAAARQGIKVFPILKMGCPLGSEAIRSDGDPFDECAQWQENIMQWIFENPPTEGVLITSTHPGRPRGLEQVPPGLVEAVRQFTEHGIHTWGVRDTPWPHRDGHLLDVRLCVAEGRYDPQSGEDCGMSRDQVFGRSDPVPWSYAGLNFTPVDITDALCDEERCPGVIGNVLVYRDSSHLTNVFSALLADEFERQLFIEPAPTYRTL